MLKRHLTILWTNIKGSANCLAQFLWSTDHKDISFLYLILGAVGGLMGTTLSVAIRLELMQPGSQIFLGNSYLYNVAITAHVFLVIFFMVIFLIFNCYFFFFCFNLFFLNVKVYFSKSNLIRFKKFLSLNKFTIKVRYQELVGIFCMVFVFFVISILLFHSVLYDVNSSVETNTLLNNRVPGALDNIQLTNNNSVNSADYFVVSMVKQHPWLTAYISLETTFSLITGTPLFLTKQCCSGISFVFCWLFDWNSSPGNSTGFADKASSLGNSSGSSSDSGSGISQGSSSSVSSSVVSGNTSQLGSSSVSSRGVYNSVGSLSICENLLNIFRQTCDVAASGALGKLTVYDVVEHSLVVSADSAVYQIPPTWVFSYDGRVFLMNTCYVLNFLEANDA